MENYYYYYDTKMGKVGIAESDNAITCLVFLDGENSLQGVEKETPLLERAASQLREYFAGTRRKFDLPLAPAGTEFQKKVWQALLDIPYGETRSYSQIALAVGNPKAGRAVGMANNRNPISIIIPCHRVIGKDGSLVGYGGGLNRKESLLLLEKGKGKSI